jgi:hypothetical protein
MRTVTSTILALLVCAAVVVSRPAQAAPAVICAPDSWQPPAETDNFNVQALL